MDSLGSGPSNALDATFGAILIGVLFATFFQGVLTVQAFNYYDKYPDDPLRLKLVVGLVCVLDTAHLGLISQAAYHYFITNWGYKPALDAPFTDALSLHLIFTALSCFICQLFFLNRIWTFSRKNVWVVGTIFFVCLIPFLLDFIITIMSLVRFKWRSSSLNTPIIVTIFISGAFGDILLTTCLCYYLYKESCGFERTRSFISRVTQFFIATGLATSLLAVGAVVAYFIRPIPHGMHFIGIHFSLGRTYTNALLATLNARRQVRVMLAATRRKKKPATPKDAVFKTIALTGPTMDIDVVYAHEQPVHADLERNINGMADQGKVVYRSKDLIPCGK